ncbi:hypothetical protein, partial [Actinoplanes subtropicus]|uniref:hypothetical protein n=1 Tax=Actinoplanes subtropicus TaxID=543632 RepID=UPI001FDF7A3F
MTTARPPSAASASRRRYLPCARAEILLHRGHRPRRERDRARTTITAADRSTTSTTTLDRCERTLIRLESTTLIMDQPDARHKISDRP